MVVLVLTESIITFIHDNGGDAMSLSKNTKSIPYEDKDISLNLCPDCQNRLFLNGVCWFCPVCGWSSCNSRREVKGG